MEKWAFGEPKPNHPCVYMDVNGQWRTALCNETFYSICEQSTGVNNFPHLDFCVKKNSNTTSSYPCVSNDQLIFCTEIPPAPPVQYPGQCPESIDGSPLRWMPFRDSCYAYVQDRQPWSAASRMCLAWGEYQFTQ